MIRNPNFQVRKRKWTTVLFLLRKRKRKNEESHQDGVKHPKIVEIFDGNEGDDDHHHENDHYRSDGSDADERDENPRDNSDEKIEGFEQENPSLDLMQEDEQENSKSALLIVSERKKHGGDTDTPPDDDCCPICFDDFSIACKTNCGHWFCGNSFYIISFFLSSSSPSMVFQGFIDSHIQQIAYSNSGHTEQLFKNAIAQFVHDPLPS